MTSSEPARAERRRSIRRSVQRRLRLTSLVAALLVGALVLVGCTGSGSSPAPKPSGAPAAVARPISFAAPTGAGQRAVHPNQYLFGVAAHGSAVVTVGYDSADNIVRPLILSSTDAGSSWSRVGPGSSGHPGRTADEYANRVGAGPGGFLAAGYAAGTPQLWLSGDGRDWRRISSPSGVFTTEDSIDAMTSTSAGWILAGTHDGAVGRGLADVVVWTSPDGSRWTRHALSALGVRYPVGTASVAGIAAIGRTWVIAGGIENDADDVQPNRLAFWRSTDAGAHWSQTRTAADLGGGYRAYAEQLVVTGGRFALLAQGHLSKTNNLWDGVWLTSDATGSAWQNGPTFGGWGTKADEYPSGIVHSGGRWVTYGSIGQSPSDARISSGTSLQNGRPLSGAGLGGVRDQHANGGAAVGDDVIVVGSSAAGASAAPMIWRVSGQQVSAIAVPPSATAGRPYIGVAEVVGVGSGYLAAGVASVTPVVWTSADGRTWQGADLPEPAVAVNTVEVSDLAVRGDGTAVVSGTLNLARGSRAAVWLKRPADRGWRVVSSSAFVSPVKNDYGFYATSAVAGGANGFVLAGTHEADGHQDVAFWFSEDGSDWRKTLGTTPIELSADDKNDNRSPYQGFRGPDNGSIDVDAVRTVGSGFVAVGTITTSGRSRIVVWSSDDGTVWSDPSALELPDGIWSASAASLVSNNRLVLTAAGFSKAGAQGQLISWVSDDGGVSWQRGTPVDGPSRADEVIAVPGGYLASGAVGTDADSDAAAWTSLDGQAWHRTSLPLPRATGSGNQAISEVIARGDQLLVMAEDEPPSGGGYYSTWVPLPKP